MTRIVILGGGPAGYEAGLVAGELGADVTIVDRRGPRRERRPVGLSCPRRPSSSRPRRWAGCTPPTAWACTSPAWTRRTRSADRTIVDFPSCPSASCGLGSDAVERHRAQGHQRGRPARPRPRAHLRRPRGHRHPRGRHRAACCPPTTCWWRRAPGPASCRSSSPTASACWSGQQVYGLPEVPEHLIVVGPAPPAPSSPTPSCVSAPRSPWSSSRDLILPTEDPDAARSSRTSSNAAGMTILRQVPRRRRATPDDDGVVVGLKDGGEVRGSHVLFTVGQVPVSARARSGRRRRRLQPMGRHRRRRRRTHLLPVGLRRWRRRGPCDARHRRGDAGAGGDVARARPGGAADPVGRGRGDDLHRS